MLFEALRTWALKKKTKGGDGEGGGNPTTRWGCLLPGYALGGGGGGRSRGGSHGGFVGSWRKAGGSGHLGRVGGKGQNRPVAGGNNGTKRGVVPGGGPPFQGGKPRPQKKAGGPYARGTGGGGGVGE